MKYLDGREQEEAERWMFAAAEEAKKALCLKAKCGTVIIKNGEVIGRGYNAPPLDREEQRTCLDAYPFPGKENFDRTCCMHAEWRAIIDALRRNRDALAGSKLYFARVDANGNPLRSGKPYCTVCSRLALDTGIAEFLLWHEQGIASYPTDEYNRLSYQYSEEAKR